MLIIKLTDIQRKLNKTYQEYLQFFSNRKNPIMDKV